MALLKKRKSRTTGEDLCTVVPTHDQIIESRGTCELTDEFLRDFLGNVQKIVTDCIEKFFEGKQMYCGGDICDDYLHCPMYVSMVMNFDVGRSVDVVYDTLERYGKVSNEESQQSFVISLLDSCAPLGIPKCFAGGLLLMYMELCLGVDLRESLTSLDRAA